MLGIKKSKTQQRVIKTIVVVGERQQNGQTIEIDGELERSSGTTDRIVVGTTLIVNDVSHPKGKSNKSFAYLQQDRNTVSTFRVVHGAFMKNDKLEVVGITYT